MLGLIVLITVCVLIIQKAKELDVSAIPYVFSAIFLAIIPSYYFKTLVEPPIAAAITSVIMSIGLCFIPYNMIKNKKPRDQEGEY